MVGRGRGGRRAGRRRHGRGGHVHGGRARRPAGPAPRCSMRRPRSSAPVEPVDLTLTSVCDDPGTPGARWSRPRRIVTPAGVRGSDLRVGRRSGRGHPRPRPGRARPRRRVQLPVRPAHARGRGSRVPAGRRVLADPGPDDRGPAGRAPSPASTGIARARPDGVAVRLPAGTGRGEIGIDGTGDEGGESGASSFDVAADGRHPRRRLGERPRPAVRRRDGRFVGSVPLPPGDPVDIAVGRATGCSRPPSASTPRS